MITKDLVWKWMEEVADPEVPVLSIVDLGIVKDVIIDDPHKVTIKITPTYSGCPAMDVIAMQIRMVLIGHGIKEPQVALVLEPAWTTDWMTEEGKEKLKKYGIAPPIRKAKNVLDLFEEDEVLCPKCGSAHTIIISRFGATSCKSM